jgi:hypothetical protein
MGELKPVSKSFQYTPSGEYSFPGIIFACLAAVAVSVLTSILYNIIVAINPFIYFSFIMMTGGFLRKGKCRNRKTAAVVGVIVGAIVYFIAFKMLYLNSAAVNEKLNQGWEIGIFYSKIHLLQVDGVLVYLVWGLEALIIVAASGLLAYETVGEPFCENCICPTVEKELGELGCVDRDKLVEALEQEDNSKVVELIVENNGDKVVSVDTYSCPKCEKCNYANISLNWLEHNGKDDPEKKNEKIIKYMYITREQLDSLNNLTVDEEG